MGFTEVLTIVFIVLKLVNVISWNWFYVLLPEIIAGVFYLVMFIYSTVEYVKMKKNMKKLFKEQSKGGN